MIQRDVRWQNQWTGSTDAQSFINIDTLAHQPKVAPQLSPREREVLQLIAEGHSSKEVAAQLAVSARTIDTYRHNIMEKLELRSIAELTKYAIRAGITSLGD